MNNIHKFLFLLCFLLTSFFTPVQANHYTLAEKLNLPVALLEQYPDFAVIASQNYFHRHLDIHQHQILVDELGSPYMLFEGEYLPWSEVKNHLELSPGGEILNYSYTFQGFVAGGQTTHLPIFKKTEMLPENGCALEILTYSAKFPPHVWVRLINSEGEIVSAGFYPNHFFLSTMEIVNALKPSKGKIYSPDFLEISTSPSDWVITRHSINQDQYDDLIAYLKTCQESRSYHYQFMSIGGYNCASFVAELAQLIGLQVSTTTQYMPIPDPRVIQQWQISNMRKLSLKKGI